MPSSATCARMSYRTTVDGTDARVLLTGQAMVTDLGDRITSRLPLFVTAIVAMSFVLLMVVFRSVLVPLKAAAMNLLSIGRRLRRDRCHLPVGLGQRAWSASRPPCRSTRSPR